MASRTHDLTVHELTGERARLVARQVEIDALLSNDGGNADLDTLRALAQERAANADLQLVVERRLAVARDRRRQEERAYRDERARALRPAERKQFLAVLEAADALFEAILAIQGGAYAELGAVGVAPLTRIPRELVQMLKPGPNGARHWWADTLKTIDAAVK